MNFKPKNWNDPNSVARAAIRLTHAAMDEAFNESDHPRDEDGKFGSGGGSGENKSGNEKSSFKKKGQYTLADRTKRYRELESMGPNALRNEVKKEGVPESHAEHMKNTSKGSQKRLIALIMKREFED